MHVSRIFLLVLGALAATSAACQETQTVTETLPAEPASGVPDQCFVRKAAPAATADAGTGGFAAPQPSGETIRCVDDVECGAGARCDTALSPPQCVTLYCVPEKGACSATEQCAGEMQCHESQCNPCNLCGNLCEVDFSSDPKNCGGCGRKIAEAQTCVEGEATCPADRPTLCGDECVDTKTDLRHCGACNKAAPAGGSCTKGKTTCGDAEQEICDGTCVDTKKDLSNCGACGHVCPGDLTCGGGYCYKSLSSETPQTCFNVCQAAGLRCGGAAAIYASTSGQPPKVVDITCSVLPSPAPPGYTFDYVSCGCGER